MSQSKFPHLSKAPIKEALIDIRVRTGQDIVVESLRVENAYIRDNYPHVKDHRMGMLGLQLTEEIQTISAAQPKTTGFIFTSGDGRQIAQFRTDGFIFNRLRPYERWESMRDEARRLWDIYLETASPDKVVRVAIRYINILELPLPVRDLSRYLTSPPAPPEGVPHSLLSFLNRLVIHDESTSAKAILTQALEASDKDIAPVVLDIDAFHEGAFDPQGDEIWTSFECLHDLKNELFFKSITDATVELCQ
ncbi:MAG: TIGR04255 family protein [Gammaproteobacteria bacterium]|nr:TIGR04255 family protein [Gammaproteobacteria bacterium]